MTMYILFLVIRNALALGYFPINRVPSKPSRFAQETIAFRAAILRLVSRSPGIYIRNRPPDVSLPNIVSGNFFRGSFASNGFDVRSVRLIHSSSSLTYVTFVVDRLIRRRETCLLGVVGWQVKGDSLATLNPLSWCVNLSHLKSNHRFLIKHLNISVCLRWKVKSFRIIVFLAKEMVLWPYIVQTSPKSYK